MHRSAVIALALLGGCAASTGERQTVGLANPASVHCIKSGGRLEIRNEPGGQRGYCHLPDGRIVEEWKFFRAANRSRSR